MRSEEAEVREGKGGDGEAGQRLSLCLSGPTMPLRDTLGHVKEAIVTRTSS